MMEDTETRSPDAPEQVFLIGLDRGQISTEESRGSLAELARLVDSAGGQVIGSELIRLREPRASTLLSKGHVENLTDRFSVMACDLVVLDDDLTAVQQRNLEKAFGIRTISRTEVILDIFATHAKTRESMTQVELAQLRYLMPRLVGASIATARMGGVGGGEGGGGGGGGGGRIATRGPGETQLEVDRRRVRQRIRHLEKDLETISRQRETQRRRRMRSGIPMVGIVGYTNAGKSTLLNQLTDAGILAQDRLFSTLDTTVRTLCLPGGLEAGLIDTVGFVNKLPPTLVAAFRATLEEVAYADLILHVVDSSSHRKNEEFAATQEILEDLKCADTPRLVAWNKIDLVEDPIERNALLLRERSSMTISALRGDGIEDLLKRLEDMLMKTGRHAILRIPYEQYDLVARLHRESQVLESRDTPDGKVMRCRLAPSLFEITAAFRLDAWPEETPEDSGGEA